MRLSDTDRASVLRTLQEIERRGYDLTPTQVDLLARLQEAPMIRPVISHADTRPPTPRPKRLPETLMFPVTYYDVTGTVVEEYEIRARDLSSAIAAVCRDVTKHRTATGMHVGSGRW